MEFNFIRGQKLIVELENEVFEGTYESGTKERIDLVNASEYPDGTKIPMMLSFYKSDVISFRILSNEMVNVKKKCNGVVNNKDDNVINLEEGLYKRLEKNLMEYVYICTLDKRYYDMIELILNHECVSIIGFHSYVGRSKLNLIALAILDKVYILDIQLFNKNNIPPEIIDILVSSSVKKITFAARSFIDSLYHCHNIKEVNNIFDIEVADLFIEKNIKKEKDCKLKSLSECLLHYLNFPKCFMDVDTYDLYKVDWQKRPLSTNSKKIAAQHCIYLNTLKNYMEKIIMNQIYEATTAHYENLKSASTLNLSKMVHSRKIADKVLDKLS